MDDNSSVDLLSRPPADPAAVQQYIQDILDPSCRDNALAELSRLRESVPDLAVSLWDSFGTA